MTEAYKEKCGSRELREDHRACSVYDCSGHSQFDSGTEHLCAAATENKRSKDHWEKNHRRYFRIADITIQLESDLPFRAKTLDPKFKSFEVNCPGEDNVVLQHRFSIPDIKIQNLGKELYRKTPWQIHKKGDSWIYLGISPAERNKSLHRVAVFNRDYTRADFYNNGKEYFLKGGLHSLSLLPTDQILMAHLLADREGCFLHACGIKWKGKGFLFAGHSEAGKSTMARMFQQEGNKAEILCDDRIIARKTKKYFKIYGTWSHGDVPEVSNASAPLKAILFLEKAKENRLIPIKEKKEIVKRSIAVLIKPFLTKDWWEKTLSVIDKIADEVPCYILRFNKSGKVVKLLEGL